VENVDYRIEIIHQYPTGVFGSFRVDRHRLGSLFHFLIDAIRNGFDVGAGITFADNKKISGCFAQFPQVQLNDIFTFFVANTFDNAVVQLFKILRDGLGPSGCGPNQLLMYALVKFKKGLAYLVVGISRNWLKETLKSKDTRMLAFSHE